MYMIAGGAVLFSGASGLSDGAGSDLDSIFMVFLFTSDTIDELD